MQTEQGPLEGDPDDRLSDTLLRVPQLLHTCVSVWKKGGLRPYNGVYRNPSPVKTMRRVSKALGIVVHEVQSFSVHLGTPLDRARGLKSAGLPDQLPATIRLLCNAKLKNLEVIFDFNPAFYDEDPTEDPSQQAIILSQDLLHITSVAGQLQLLVKGLGPALHSVTYLALSFLTGAGDSTLQAFTNMLGATVLPLAAACPKVEKLRLDGDLGLAAMTALGQAFPGLRRLELTTCSIPITTIVALNTIFPYLTHLSVFDSHNSPFEVSEEDKSVYVQAVLVSLSAFTTLTHLEAKYMNSPARSSTWQLLPSNLEELTIGEMLTCNVPEGLRMPCLTRLELECDSRDTTLLETIMRVAPNLRQLNALVNLRLNWDSCAIWRLLSERMAQGLGFDDCNVRLTTGPHVAGLLSEVLPLLPPLPAVEYLIATIRTKLPSMMQLARVFPNLISLQLVCAGTTDAAIRELSSCTALQSLQVEGAGLVKIEDPEEFCRCLPALRELTFGKCSAAAVAQLPGLQALWDEKGLRVKLDVRRNEGHGYEDDDE